MTNSQNFSEENDVYYCNNIDNIVNTAIWKKLPIKFKQACIAKAIICGVSPEGEVFVGTFIDSNYNVNWMNIKIGGVKVKHIWNTGEYIGVVTDEGNNSNAYYCTLDPFLLNTFSTTKSSSSFGTNYGLHFKSVCPPGSYVTEFYGANGSIIDNIGIKCSNGKDLGSYGGNGGSYFQSKSPDGFSKIKIEKTSDTIKSLQFYNNQGSVNTAGTFSSNTANQKNLCCPNKIVGIYGNRDSYVRQLGIVCGDEGLNKNTTETFKTKYLLKNSSGRCLTYVPETLGDSSTPESFTYESCKDNANNPTTDTNNPNVNQLFDIDSNNCVKIKPTTFLGNNAGPSPQSSCNSNVISGLNLSKTSLQVLGSADSADTSDEECKTKCPDSQILLSNETCVNRLQCGYNEEQSITTGNCECVYGTRKYNRNTLHIYYDGDYTDRSEDNQIVCENNPENTYYNMPGFSYYSDTYTPI